MLFQWHVVYDCQMMIQYNSNFLFNWLKMFSYYENNLLFVWLKKIYCYYVPNFPCVAMYIILLANGPLSFEIIICFFIIIKVSWFNCFLLREYYIIYIGNCLWKKKFANFMNLEAFINYFCTFILVRIFIYEIAWIVKVFSWITYGKEGNSWNFSSMDNFSIYGNLQ